MIRIEHTGTVSTLVLDRPERRNALSSAMIGQLKEAIEAAGADPNCHCLVIKGAGAHFCAGRELTPGLARSLEPVLEYDDAYGAVFQALVGLQQPSVAVVTGYAVAGGFTLAMGCDFVLADETARFGAMEMKNGFPAAINTALLSHLGAPRSALELLLLGDPVPARTLFERGLINRLAPDAAALATLERTFTAALAALDPTAVRLARETFQTMRAMPLNEALTYGKTLNALLLASGRIEQAAEAFSRNRRPR